MFCHMKVVFKWKKFRRQEILMFFLTAEFDSDSACKQFEVLAVDICGPYYLKLNLWEFSAETEQMLDFLIIFTERWFH